MQPRFRGIFIPLITPFHDDGEVDFDALAEVTEFMIERKVHGLFVIGSTGDGPGDDDRATDQDRRVRRQPGSPKSPGHKSLLQRFEEEIGDSPYLAGDFSLLDAAVVPRFLRIETRGPLADPSMPRLRDWLKRMKERASVQRIIAAGMPEVHSRRAD